MRGAGFRTEMHLSDPVLASYIVWRTRKERMAVIFWLAAGTLVVAVTALLVATMEQRPTAPGAALRAPEQRIFAEQLREIDRDTERGILGLDEAQRLRNEVARRILDRDRDAVPVATTRGPTMIAAVIVVFAVLGGGVTIYGQIGAPDYPDLPMSRRIAEAEALRAARPSQAAAEASVPALKPLPVDAAFLKLMDALRARVAERPDDAKGQQLLAENESRLGNHAAAARAETEVVRLKGKYVAPEDHVILARMMIAAAGGAISPEAEKELGAALLLNPNDSDALFLIGLSEMRVGRPDHGFQAWRRLIETAEPDNEWLPEVLARIGDLAAVAGVDYAPPADLATRAAPGPAAADVDAAADMTPEARDTMIRSMVEGLAERLATKGGSAEEWARLITSLGTLGDTDRARAIWDEAAQVFAEREADLSLVRQAAVAAGIAP